MALDIKSDKVMAGVPVRERYERFCGHFVETRNAGQAFRLAFVVDKTTAAQWVHDKANELLREPAIMERVQELRDTAAAMTLASVRDLIQDYHDIATADPNEIVSHVLDACRFCYGIDHRYQWASDAEYAEACDAAVALQKALPDMSGGFDYNPTREPSLTCPCCFGRGEGRVIAHDTTKLTGSARKLYAGAKETKQGIEIKMHDQLKAREALGRILGAFKDGIPLTPVLPQHVNQTTAQKEQDAGRAYLRLVGGTDTKTG